MCGRARPGCGRRGPPLGLWLARSCRAIGRTFWEGEGSVFPSHHACLRESGADLVPGEEMHPAYVSGLAASPAQAWPRRSTASAALRTVSSA